MPKKIASLPSHQKRGATMKICGVIIFALSVIQLIFWKTVFNILLEGRIVLKPNTKTFEVWKTPPMTLTLDFYMFNWTNPEEFYNADIKPKLQQVGPYRFIEKPDKVDIQWHNHNASVTYRRRSKFLFDASGSAGSLNDKITTINSLAVTIARTSKNWGYFVHSMLNVYYKTNKIYIKKSAGELLFGGYSDPLLDLANGIPKSLLDFTVPFDKYGYCYGRNDSADFHGPINIYTGADDINKIGHVHTWKYSQETKANGPGCNKVQGSLGELQPPHLQENKPIEYFLPDLCRSMEMDYSEQVEVEGIQAFKYIGSERAMDNGTKYEKNKCYCNGKCVPSGLMNVSSCWYDSPIFMSYPHFYKADPIYLDQVEGLNPNKEEHELFLTLEPETGYAIDVRARLQTNILVKPVPFMDMFENVREIFFPLFWLEERTSITPELASELKLVPTLAMSGFLGGWIGIFVALILYFWRPASELWRRHMLKPLEIDGFANNLDQNVKLSQENNRIHSLILSTEKHCECQINNNKI